MTLSVCLIVKNEESCLAKCLESVKGANEIVVVDTGSTDKTVEIARKYTNQVIVGEYKWNDNFAEARNFAIGQCIGDWVLMIDADEELKVPLSVVMGNIQFAEENKKKTIDVMLRSKRGGEVHRFPRLFKRCPEVFFKGAIHNYLSIVEENSSDIVIEYGYSEAHKKDPDRSFRILAKEVKRNPQCVREKYYLAREYWYRKDYKSALQWWGRYLQVATWPPEIADALLMQARCLWQLQQGEQARRVCAEALAVNTNFKEAAEFLAKMSGPINRKRWLEFAKGADNSGVLFLRT